MRRASSSSSDIAGSTDNPFQEKWLLLVDEMKEEWAKVGGISMGIVEVVITVATLQFHAGARSPMLFTFGALTTVCGLIGTVLSFYHTIHAYVLSNLNIEKVRAEVDTSLNRPYLLALPVLCACPRAFFIWTLIFFACSIASLAWSLTLDLKPSSDAKTPGPNQDPPPLPLVVPIAVSIISIVLTAFATLDIVRFGSLVDAQPYQPEEPPRELLNMSPLSTPRPRLAPLRTEDLKAGYSRGGPMTV
ncbi:hypothetical protein PHLCEN_2v7023 [Hermanssonia centrifuga]|uniref:Transmembrane protein n=1 Tax=Hermanssonia centrifuga TaxID=98765 RepID=A0A2R6NXW8_9APHY|nr:hypothetical protein PHLCEN_2v7023 [Hermanssonia centrifuga]